MSWFRLIYRTVVYYAAPQAALLLGVVVATAVLTGALIVGDSVRASLLGMSLNRLGGTEVALVSPRFFREDLAHELAQRPDVQNLNQTIAPALVLPASVVKHQGNADSTGVSLRAGHVQLYGVKDSFWKVLGDGAPPAIPEDGVILNARLAAQLQARVGDELQVWLELPSAIPRESLLGKKEETTRRVDLKVTQILEANETGDRFGLRPNQQSPLNAYVALGTLQKTLELDARRPSKREREGSLARVNALFVGGNPANHPLKTDLFDQALRQVLQLTDLDLRIVPQAKSGYLSIESRRMILEDSLASSLEAVAKELSWSASPGYVYLANELMNATQPEAYSMYSVVAGLDLPTQPPFGPFEFIGAVPRLPLQEHEIVLNEWLAADTKATIGTKIQLKYHLVGSRGELPEVTEDFQVVGITRLGNTPAADRGLTPEVKGMTDAKSLNDWDQPFEMDFKRITDRDHAYWAQNKATPKAFVSLATAQRLWKSRYGKLTSLRVAPPASVPLEQATQTLTAKILEKVPLVDLGMTFTPVREQGLAAASGNTDFGGLFIGFSLFLILSAIILVQLLFRLGIERRASQIGLLAATGVPPKGLRRLMLGEGLFLVVIGTALGILAAIGYAELMIYGLKTWWNRAIGTQFLFVSVQPVSLLIGAVSVVAIAGMSIAFSLRKLGKIPVRSLLAGNLETPSSKQRDNQRRGLVPAISLGLSAVLTLGCLTGIIPDTPGMGPLSWRTVAFFVAGMSSLIGGMTVLQTLLRSEQLASVGGRGWLGLGKLGLRNAARQPGRTMLTVWLIASATFLITAVAAGQRNPARELPEKYSGNGGFTLVAESARPILHDLNTRVGREKLGLDQPDFIKAWEAAGNPKVYPFRVKPGDDSSCLNLYQTQRPTLLGAPADFIDRGGFKFADQFGENPWKILSQRTAAGDVPAFGDMNTLLYSLHKGVGTRLGIPDDAHATDWLQIAGMFDGAIFQGVLVLSEAEFTRLFPEQTGYQYFLIEVDPQHATALSQALETGLEPFGFDVDRVAERLADFLAVQNTYLSTFQTLGGLGLLLGTLGLAAVMLRNVLERRSELALLRAVGFTPGQLAWLIGMENLCLLLWGLLVGTGSALLAMLPHLISIGGDFSWSQTGAMLLLVALSGNAASLLAIRAALKLPVLSTLRAEA